jgi:hypothetical protein
MRLTLGDRSARIPAPDLRSSGHAKGVGGVDASTPTELRCQVAVLAEVNSGRSPCGRRTQTSARRTARPVPPEVAIELIAAHSFATRTRRSPATGVVRSPRCPGIRRQAAPDRVANAVEQICGTAQLHPQRAPSRQLTKSQSSMTAGDAYRNDGCRAHERVSTCWSPPTGDARPRAVGAIRLRPPASGSRPVR